MKADGLILTNLVLDYETDILCLSLQTSTGLLLSGCRNGKMQLWSYHSHKIVLDYNDHDGSILCCSISKIKDIAVTGGDDGIIRFYDTTEYKFIGESEKVGPIHAICFSNLSKYVISGGVNGELNVWDVVTRKLITKLSGHDNTINSLYVNSADYMLSGSDDKKVILWNLDTLTYERQLGCEDNSTEDDSIVLDHTSSVISVSLSSDLNWGISCDKNGKVIVWSIRVGIPEAMCTMEGDLNTVLFSTDDTSFYCSTNDCVEKWIVDWVLTYEGREYPPPIWLLSHCIFLNLFYSCSSTQKYSN